MSILDDAIREHLELKRAHGADDAELKKLEDEAFGPPARPEEPDPFAEAPTEFLTAPEGGAEDESAESAPSGRREPNIADLQEAPEPPKEASSSEAAAEHPEAPAEEEQPAMEHEVVPEPAAEPEPDGSHTTQERQEIAEQPTEYFDVESAIESEPDAPTDLPSPSDEDLVDAELAEPRLAPVDPLSGIEASAAEAEAAEEPVLDDEEDEDDFFSEQRLSDELNQALEAPLTEEQPALPEEDDEYEEEEPPEAEPEPEEHEDVLEDTPDFLEDAPEDDNLWFEQRPPKDFDFDD